MYPREAHLLQQVLLLAAPARCRAAWGFCCRVRERTHAETRVLRLQEHTPAPPAAERCAPRTALCGALWASPPGLGLSAATCARCALRACGSACRCAWARGAAAAWERNSAMSESTPGYAHRSPHSASGTLRRGSPATKRPCAGALAVLGSFPCVSGAAAPVL